MSTADEQGKIRVGCQGWNYEDWVTPPAGARAVFYPQGTRGENMLEVYARAFETVEVDSTLYGTPKEQAVEGWVRRTPPGFTFSLKLPREITHDDSLKGAGAAAALAEFSERARGLGSKLAVLLVQLPPQFEATTTNIRALASFLPQLPSDLRFAVELRHPSWFEGDLLEPFAREPHITLALVEGRWVARERIWRAAAKVFETTGFAYIRWMGERDIYRFDAVCREMDANLGLWARVVERLRDRGLEVFAYFSNFYEGFAPASANKLKRLLGQDVVEAEELEDQGSLF